MILIITSFLHYLAILPILFKYNVNKLSHFHTVYVNLIIVTTSISIIWHYYQEPYNYLMAFDYYFSSLWFIADMLWALDLCNISILYLNIGSFILNIIINYSNNYILYHSIWHVLNALKCIYVSYLITKHFLY